MYWIVWIYDCVCVRAAFPTGGFTHSLGLESSVQHKQVQHTGNYNNKSKVQVYIMWL